MKKSIALLLCASLAFASSAASAAPKGKVLLVTSSTDTLVLKDGTLHPTGYFLDELTVPVMHVMKEGYEVVLATQTGNILTMDPVLADVSLFLGDKKALDEALKFVKSDPVMTDAIAEASGIRFDY